MPRSPLRRRQSRPQPARSRSPRAATPRRWPAVDEGRHPDDQGLGDDPLFAIPRLEPGDYPFGGSGIVYWDSGPGVVTAPPTTNTPPGSPQNGSDPHGHPRNTVAARLQKSEFLQIGGALVDVCGGLPCHTDQYQP